MGKETSLGAPFILLLMVHGSLITIYMIATSLRCLRLVDINHLRGFKMCVIDIPRPWDKLCNPIYFYHEKNCIGTYHTIQLESNTFQLDHS